MRVILNHVRINYEIFGRGPAVLFITDHQHDSQLWNPMAGPLITSGFKVLLVEVDNRNNIKEAAKAIITLLNSLGIGRAALCGLEQGSLLQQLRDDYPQRIALTFEASHPDQLSAKTPVHLDNIETVNQHLLDYLNSHAHRAKKAATSSLATAA